MSRTSAAKSLKTPSRKETIVRRNTMSSSLKCFQAMELLASKPFELTLSEISTDLVLPLASTHRILATLCKAGLLEQDPTTRRYRLTGKALWIGAAYLRRSQAYLCAFPILQETAKKCHGLVHLATIESDQVLYLHTVGSPSTLYLYADTGELRPMHCTGLGKALLAFQPTDVVERILGRNLEKLTPKTITSPAALREQMERIRQRGYSIDDEENAQGLRCLAAPILDASGRAAAALSISAPTSVLTKGLIEHYAAIIREAAHRVSAQLGHRSVTMQFYNV